MEDIRKIREVILNDSHRKELSKALFDLYAKALPMALKKDDGTVVCSYSDEVEGLAEKIREQIRLRDDEIFKAHSQSEHVAVCETCANQFKSMQHCSGCGTSYLKWKPKQTDC